MGMLGNEMQHNEEEQKVRRGTNEKDSNDYRTSIADGKVNYVYKNINYTYLI